MWRKQKIIEMVDGLNLEQLKILYLCLMKLKKE